MTAPQGLPLPGPRLVLRAALAFAAALALWYASRGPYTRLVAAAGAELLARESGIPAREILRVEKGRFLLATGMEVKGRPEYRDLAAYPVTWNSVLLGTLLLLTPLRVLRAAWGRALLAAGGLLASQVLFFTWVVHAQVALLHEERGMTFQSPGLTRSMAYLAEAYSLTLGPLLPFLLYAPVLLAARKLGRRPPAGAAPGSQPAARVPRNAPCPCGSGKKHKRCCGR